VANRGRTARLWAQEAKGGEGERDEAEAAQEQRVRAARHAVAARVREGLARRGLDPDGYAALRRIAAEPDLPPPWTPADPPPRAADADRREGPSVADQLARMGERMRGAPPPDPARASLMDLYAWVRMPDCAPPDAPSAPLPTRPGAG
jgi:hypothetical protein